MKKNKRLIEDSELSGFCLGQHFRLGSIFLEEGKNNLVATFDLLVREAPHRNFLLAGGLEAIIGFIDNIHYGEDFINYLSKVFKISKNFAAYLKNFSFSGDIYAMPEGTVCFPGEPMIRVTAPIIEANLITDQIIALANIDTLMLSKLARIKLALNNKNIRCSIGSVRAQGIDSGWRALRSALFFENMAFSNAVAGFRLGTSGMGIFNANHAYIKSFDNEIEAFRAATRDFPDVSPMIDTYDIRQGLENAIIMAGELKRQGKKMDSIFIDSGDQASEAKYARKRLDASGYSEVKIILSGNIDEYKITKYIKENVPVDGLAMVTEVTTSSDSPKLETVFKLAQLKKGKDIRYTAKFSVGKLSLPGEKQVYRKMLNGKILNDIIGLENEKNLGEPLLVPIFKKGKLVYKIPSMEQNKIYVAKQLSLLSDNLKEILNDHKAPIEISQQVKELLEVVRSQHVVDNNIKM